MKWHLHCIFPLSASDPATTLSVLHPRNSDSMSFSNDSVDASVNSFSSQTSVQVTVDVDSVKSRHSASQSLQGNKNQNADPKATDLPETLLPRNSVATKQASLLENVKCLAEGSVDSIALTVETW